jgi:dTDP-4-amino-4,6-dideoxygalactose transaminase
MRRFLPARSVVAGVRVMLRGDLARYTTRGTSEATRFEEELGRALGSAHTLGVNSGTSALICALVGAGVGPGDEVLVPAYTWVSSAAAALAVGAIPVLVEIDESLTIDPLDIKEKLTAHTKVIMPVHMQNLVCDMDAVTSIAREHRLVVVEDACQAIGVTYKGRAVGTIGDVGALSFQQYKTIFAGEGGALLTDDQRIAARGRMYHDVGSYIRKDTVEDDEPLLAGLSLRMPELTAALLRPQVRRLNKIIDRLISHRQLALQQLERSKFTSFEVSPHHDPAAAAGLSISFDSETAAMTFAAETRGVARLIDTGRHVYTNWEPLASQTPVHPKLDPYAWAHQRVDVSPSACPRTLDILARTCLIPLRFDLPTPVYQRWLRQAIV